MIRLLAVRPGPTLLYIHRSAHKDFKSKPCQPKQWVHPGVGPTRPRTKTPRSTPIGVRSFIMALKKRNKNTTKKFRICSHIKILRVLRASNPWPSTCFRLLTLVPTILWHIDVFYIFKEALFIFRNQSKKRAHFFFLFSSTMDQGGSSLGLEPFVRCPVDKLLSMNSVRAF